MDKDFQFLSPSTTKRSRGQLVEFKSDLRGISVTHLAAIIAINLVTSKAAAKHELLLNEPASEASWSNSSQT